MLKRNELGDIIVDDKPEYYLCDGLAAIEDAFSVYDFSDSRLTVYVEGKTDEKYLKKAKSLFGETQYDFDIVAIGRETNEGSKNGGCKSLDKAYDFLTSQDWSMPTLLLYDCDTKVDDCENGNIQKHRIQTFKNAFFPKGIEHALVLPSSFDLTPYTINHDTIDEFHLSHKNPTFDKNKLCNVICALSDNELAGILSNCKIVLDDINRMLYK